MYEYHAKVKRVVDGDTVDFVVDLGFKIHTTIRTRLIGVDTPERGHEDWTKATDKCSELLMSVAEINFENEPGEEWWVKIRTTKTGKYGRWLVDIDGVTDILKETWPYERINNGKMLIPIEKNMKPEMRLPHPVSMVRIAAWL